MAVACSPVVTKRKLICSVGGGSDDREGATHRTALENSERGYLISAELLTSPFQHSIPFQQTLPPPSSAAAASAVYGCSPPLHPRLLLPLPHLPHPPSLRRTSSSYHPAVVRCVLSGGGGGGGGGGVADEFVYTRRSQGGGSQRQFSALADLLLRIEPLDTQVVGKGVSAHAKVSMKKTISAMLGLLPSDQFHVSVRLFKRPLHQLLLSSVITGYTLWNAEYRISLMRNYDISPDNRQQNKTSDNFEIINGAPKNKTEGESRTEESDIYLEMGAHESLGELSSAAERYIGNMESELQNLQKELDAQKCENLYLEHNREDSNDLLEYLRSLDPLMVNELSKPSSSEVEGIIYKLAQSIHHKFFNEAKISDEADESGAHTSRDHLAKLLFWCMLMGHHLRGLEYRLHLSWLI